MTEAASAGGVVPRMVWLATGLLTLQSFLQGYIIAALNPALVTGDKASTEACFDGTDTTCPKGSIYTDLELTTLEVGLATSLVMLGGFAGCMLAIKPSEMWGRKFTLLANNVIYITGGVLAALGLKSALFVGRFISGIAVGASSTVVPIMLSEISTDAYRGTITTCHQVMLTLAILAASLTGYGFVNNYEHGWQYCQGLEVFPAVLMLLCTPYVPESPKWLVSKGRIDDAVTQLTFLRDEGENVRLEVNAIVDESRSNAQDDNVSWKEVMVSRRGVVISIMLMFIQAMTGINSVVFYSTTIFRFAGVDNALLATTMFGLLNFFVTVGAASLVDKYGRKVLMLTGTCIMFVALVVLAAALLSGSSKTQGFVAVAAVLTYVLGFAMGLGAVSWVVMCELVPTRSRSKAMSLFLTINWLGNFLIGFFSLDCIDGLGGLTGGMSDSDAAEAEKHGVAYLYVIFATVTFLSCIYIYVEVPETKGRKPEDFQEAADMPLITEDFEGQAVRKV